jgi:hypothetical protein
MFLTGLVRCDFAGGVLCDNVYQEGIDNAFVTTYSSQEQLHGSSYIIIDSTDSSYDSSWFTLVTGDSIIVITDEDTFFDDEPINFNLAFGGDTTENFEPGGYLSSVSVTPTLVDGKYEWEFIMPETTGVTFGQYLTETTVSTIGIVSNYSLPEPPYYTFTIRDIRIVKSSIMEDIPDTPTHTAQKMLKGGPNNCF